MAGSRLQKRIGALKQELDADGGRKFGFLRSLFLFSLLFGVIFFFLGKIGTDTPEIDNQKFAALSEEARETARWWDSTRSQVIERADMLKSLWGESSAQSYLSVAESIVGGLLPEAVHAPPARQRGLQIDFGNWRMGVAKIATGGLLRLVFVLYISWPIWLFGVAASTLAVRYFIKPKPTQDILGILDRGNGPFYSGIHGPLRPNQNVSGTDLSAPNLASPKLVNRQVALGHSLTQLLKKYDALNETNIWLVQVILAYADYPSFVEEERPAEEEQVSDTSANQKNANTQNDKGLVTNQEGTLEKSALEGLRATLEAHQALMVHSKSMSAQKLDSNKRAHLRLQNLEKISSGLSPLGKILAEALTAQHIDAIAGLPATMVASAALGIEAGKCLVYRPVSGGYSQISRFPHLQARSILQSSTHYHTEYSGDARLVIRQAVLCSRRHGDFGRSFAPDNMPVASRALRNWLEILYSHSSKRNDIAYLTELESQIEELYSNWLKNLREALQEEKESENLKGQNTTPSAQSIFRKGTPCKSVVLFPLPRLLEISHKGIHPERQNRILELFQLTKKLQTELSISARLPGFKRQAVDAERSSPMPESLVKEYKQTKEGANLLDKWIIVRRMLIRYNWLSTRVGDDTVPLNGLVHAIFIDKENKEEPLGLDALIPLRGRRFRESLGDRWEQTFYTDSPHPNNIEVFVDNEDFRERLKKHMEQKDKASEGTSSEKVGNTA